MNTHSVFIVQRLAAWLLFSFAVVTTIVLLSGKASELTTNGWLLAAVLMGILITGELLTSLKTHRALARRAEMRALITPFYATLRRTVKAPPDDEDAPAVGTPEPEFEFDATTAAIVQDEDNAYKDEAGRHVYEIHRYARSPDGEYFSMILQAVDGEPGLARIKHVEQQAARAALGKRYVAPAPPVV